MTVFSRVYNNNILEVITFDEIDNLISDEKNKTKITEALYNRFYGRYIKIFFYESYKYSNYIKTVDGEQVVKPNTDFNAEYKNGFSIMANCCLLIETMIAFLQGDNKTSTYGDEAFNGFF